MSVVSLTDYQPSARFDGNAWTQARLEQATSASGPWTTVETFNLSPVDADPQYPALRNFTSELVDAASTWLRIVFIDADADEQATSAVAATSTDLVTVEDVRRFLQKQSTDTGQDPIIATLISRASKAIIRYTEREFAPAGSAGEARTFEYAGGSFLSLSPYDLRAITRVRLDIDEASPTTLTSSDYRLYPNPASEGVYTAIRLAPYLIHSSTRWQQRLVEITGTWGFASVPEEVKHWTIVTVALWLRRDVATFESTFSIDEERLERPQALPSAVRAGLSHHKRDVYT